MVEFLWVTKMDMIKKIRILIIDDEAEFTWLLQLNLEGTGRYEVRTEQAGMRGVAAARDFQPDLILLDLIMPDVSGGEVADQLTGDVALTHIPMIFLTAMMCNDRLAATEGCLGGDYYLAKPFTLQELIERMEQRLAAHQATTSRKSRAS